MKLPTASHTMLATFENCPHKGFRMYIAKDLPKEPPTEAMEWGKAVHKAFQMRLSRGRPFPKNMEQYEQFAAPLISLGNSFTELPLGVRPDGESCAFNDAAVYCRGYADFAVIRDKTAVIFDWKSGKKKEDPAELKVHAMMLKAAYPWLTRIIGYYVWLQDLKVGKMHDLSDTHVTWAKVNEQMDEIDFMLRQNNFPKTPNPLCGWCPVKSCEHNKGV